MSDSDSCLTVSFYLNNLNRARKDCTINILHHQFAAFMSYILSCIHIIGSLSFIYRFFIVFSIKSMISMCLNIPESRHQPRAPLVDGIQHHRSCFPGGSAKAAENALTTCGIQQQLGTDPWREFLWFAGYPILYFITLGGFIGVPLMDDSCKALLHGAGNI